MCPVPCARYRVQGTGAPRASAPLGTHSAEAQGKPVPCTHSVEAQGKSVAIASALYPVPSGQLARQPLGAHREP